MLGFMGRTRTRQLDARSSNDHVLAAWEQFQAAEIKLAAAVAAGLLTLGLIAGNRI